MAQSNHTEPWFTLSIEHGNLIQLSGLLSGLALLVQARRSPAPTSSRLLLLSWGITYFCNHASAHWAVGRLGGIHFVGYGVHGTTSPSWYPPGLRWIFRHIPFLSARTDAASLQAAHPAAKLAMYLAAPVFTICTGLAIPWYGARARIPHARAVLLGASVWFLPMVIVEAMRSGGDLRRAWREACRLSGRGTPGR